MRYFALIPAFLLSACSTTSSLSSNEPVERCENTDCFNQTQIRDFDVVNPTTMIVYVGSQHCPFKVELSGTFCDITFTAGFRPVFRPSLQRERRTAVGAFGDSVALTFSEVCSNDLSLGIEDGAFSEVGGSESELTGLDCRIRSIASVTDDEILELYVDEEITQQPPPFGIGQVRGGEAPPSAEASPKDESPEASELEPDPIAATQ